MLATAHPTPSSAAALAHAPATPALELLEARQQRDALKALLRREQAAMADFLIALADFDAHRGWEALGHANLFAFINAELGLSPDPTYWRQEAARLLRRFPDLVEPLRRGVICLTTMAELAKVLTEENKESVLPRFLGISSREAKEIVVELRPREAPATRTVVTRLPRAEPVSTDVVHRGSYPSTVEASPPCPAPAAVSQPALSQPTPTGAPPSQLWAPKVDFGGVAGPVARRDEIEPLSMDRSRLHVSVSRQFTRKLETARRGLGHTIPHATIEQALEAALDLLLEKQARARGQARRPRATLPATASPDDGAGARSDRDGRGVLAASAAPLELPHSPPPPARRTGSRAAIPAAVKRAVWQRDGGRCSWPLDSSGVCGSTQRLEFDHVKPWARHGEPTVANLRVVCRAHNAVAARREFGAHCVDRYAG